MHDPDWIDLADYARGLKKGEEHARIEDHMGAGCARCRDALSTLEVLTADSRNGLAGTAPERAVRAAGSLIRLRRSDRLQRAEVRPRLVFDSFSTVLPAGVRGVPEGERHLRYESGRCKVALTIPPAQRGERAIFGQMVCPEDERFRCAQVVLITGDQVLSSAFADPVGGFELAAGPEEGLELWLLSSDGGGVAIELPPE